MTKKDEIELDLKNLLEHFQKNGREPVLQEELNQILITVKVNKIEFPLLVKVREGGEMLQLLAFFPCNTKDGCQADTARCLHLLNKEIDLPGFGMDDLNGLIFYRCMMPCLKNVVNVTILDKFTNAIFNICESFFPLIFNISQGTMKFSEISTRYENMQKALEGENVTDGALNKETEPSLL